MKSSQKIRLKSVVGSTQRSIEEYSPKRFDKKMDQARHKVDKIARTMRKNAKSKLREFKEEDIVTGSMEDQASPKDTKQKQKQINFMRFLTSIEKSRRMTVDEQETENDQDDGEHDEALFAKI